MTHDALLQTAQQAIQHDDLPLAHLICAHRRAILAGGDQARAALEHHLLGRGAAGRLRPLRLPAPHPGAPIWGHSDGVRRVRVDGDRILSVGADGLMRVWTPDGLLLGELRAPPDAPCLLVGERVYLARDAALWSWTPGESERLCAQLHATITALLATPDGVIVIATADDALWRWDEDAPQPRALGPGAACELALRAGHLITLDAAGALTIRPLAEPEALRHIPAPIEDYYDYSRHAALWPDGRLLVDHVRDDPGGIYGPSSTWSLLDPVTLASTPAQPSHVRPLPPAQLLADGREVRAAWDGVLWCCPPETPTPEAPHFEPAQVAADPRRLWCVYKGQLTAFDAQTSAPFALVSAYQSELRAIIPCERGCLTISHYQHQHAYPPVAWVRDLEGALLHKLLGGKSYQAWMAASPDGAMVVSRDEKKLTALTLDGQERWRAAVPWQYYQRWGWSTDSAQLAVALRGSALVRVEVDSGRRVAILNTEMLDSARFALSPDGERLIADRSYYGFTLMRADDGSTLRDITRGVSTGLSSLELGEEHIITGSIGGQLQRIQDATLRDVGQSGSTIRRIALRGQRALVVGERALAQVWRLDTDELERSLEGHQGEVGACVWIDDSHYASADEDGVILVWEDGQREPIHRITGHPGPLYALAVLPDGALLSGGVGGAVCAWRDGEALWSQASDYGTLLSLQPSADGARLLVRGDKGQAVWELGSERRIPLDKALSAPQLTPDGAHVIARTSLGRMELFEAASGAALRSLPWGAVSPWIAQLWPLPATSQLALLTNTGELSCIEASSGEPAWSQPGPYTHVALDARAAALWAGAKDGAVVRIACEDGARAQLYQHAGEVRCVAAGPTGMVASAGLDGVVVVFEPDGALRALWAHDRPLVSCALSHDRLIVADNLGQVCVFALV
jgi:hypothetical protein